jgi:hypothetical protein
MKGLGTRRIIVDGKALELWENPDACFECTPDALRRYVRYGAWVTLFNALTLESALRAE